MSIDKAKWIEGYAKESHEDRVMSIVEDGSCLDLLVKMALESVSLRADLEHERLRAEGAERESADANRVLVWHREQTVKSVADNMTSSDTIAALRAELADARAGIEAAKTRAGIIGYRDALADVREQFGYSDSMQEFDRRLDCIPVDEVPEDRPATGDER